MRHTVQLMSDAGLHGGFALSWQDVLARLPKLAEGHVLTVIVMENAKRGTLGAAIAVRAVVKLSLCCRPSPWIAAFV